jgi:transposase
MPANKTKSKLKLNFKDKHYLQKVSNAYNETFAHVQRATMMLEYHRGQSIINIADMLAVSRSTVYNCINKALEFGIYVAIDDLPRSGRPAVITDEAKAWIISTSCGKPKDFGLPHELWTRRLLAEYISKNCAREGFHCLSKISNGTITKILNKHDIKPHKINYYLEKRDPDFNAKAENVIAVYNEAKKCQTKNNRNTVYISFDEKPGIQAVKNAAPDLPPVPGKFSCFSRDHEYLRLGTVSFLAGMDLTTGIIHGMVENTHRSYEFIKFLKLMIKRYPDKKKFKMVLDNHSVHTSKETRAYLSTVPNKFVFIFTPKHGSWLNMIESFFGKMSKSVLRGIRVDSPEELKKRILLYLKKINKDPVIYKWTYQP